MRRIIECTKDNYITNKYINGTSVTGSNVGQAGTLDLFKLYNETYVSGVNPVVEKSFLLLKFNTDKIRSITSSINLDSNNFLNDIVILVLPSKDSLFSYGQVFHE